MDIVFACGDVGFHVVIVAKRLVWKHANYLATQIVIHTALALRNNIIKLSKSNRRINLILQDIEVWKENDIKDYSNQLNQLANFIFNEYSNSNYIEINVLTDILNVNKMSNCDVGNNTFALAPNGKIYFCPAFYFENENNFVGTLEDGIKIKNEQLLIHKNSPVCSICDSYHCKRCKYLNKKLTGEINIPSRIQCVISHIERNRSKDLKNVLEEANIFNTNTILDDLDYLDPFEKVINNKRRI